MVSAELLNKGFTRQSRPENGFSFKKAWNMKQPIHVYSEQIKNTCKHQRRDYFINMLTVNDEASRKLNEISGAVSLKRK